MHSIRKERERESEGEREEDRKRADKTNQLLLARSGGDATQVFGMHKQQPVSRTPWQTDGHTVGQTNRHFSIFYSRQGEGEEEEGEEAEAGTTFATTCRDISLLLSCLYCALFLPLSLFL